jgi:hypothetical protein
VCVAAATAAESNGGSLSVRLTPGSRSAPPAFGAEISPPIARRYAEFRRTQERRLHSSGEDAMHSMQIVEWGKPLEPRDRPTPRPQGTEVLVKVAACGVCHSDLHLQDGYFDLGGGNKLELEKLGLKLPHTLGHEIVGEVVAVGPEAAGARIGDKRVVHPWIGCGSCETCRRGDELLCTSMRSLGARRDGRSRRRAASALPDRLRRAFAGARLHLHLFRRHRL